MKFTAPRNELAAALATVLRAIEQRQTLQILSHVLIETTDTGLLLVGTNLEVDIRATAAANIDVPGKGTVPARKLYDIVRNLPEGAEIKLEFEENKAQLRCGRSRLTLPVMNALEFPRLDDRGLDQCIAFEVPEVDLKRLMKSVGFQMPTGDVRMYMNGMLLHVTDGELRAVAGSSFTMGMASLKSDAFAALEAQVILPTKSASELMDLLTESETLASVRMSRSMFEIRCIAGVLQAKAIDSLYPDYMRLMNVERSSSLKIERESIKRALARITLVSDQTKRGVSMLMRPDSVTLETRASHVEDGEDHIEATFDGPPDFEIGFSAVALAETLSAIPGSEVIIRFGDTKTPTHLASADGSGGRYVLAPMVI